MRIILALGGNALLKRGEVLSAENQHKNMKLAAKHIAKLARQHDIIIVHGNGPQVGLLALEGEAYKQAPAHPLDVLVAESQGMIGYIIGQQLRNEMADKNVITVLTQIEVDKNDSAFQNPHKFIGPVYAEAEAQELAKTRGWSIAQDGQYFRRTVPSPKPQKIIELSQIKILLEAGSVVITAGGGGIPVIFENNKWQGVEGVIDKDLSAALLAQNLDADRLIILTDVDGIYENFGKPNQQLIRNITVKELQNQKFPAGSMAPKVSAVCWFVKSTGNAAMIGGLEQLEDILAGKVGTLINP
ncbi:MAG: carbamate kinase [Alphaproteobacteria bacterium]|nr:carbamate kinase [Alphaproteobacteria bacterium]